MTRRRNKRFVRQLALLAALGGCAAAPNRPDSGRDAGAGDAGAVVEKGERILGLDLLYTTPASSFAENLATARAAGATAFLLALDWNQIEADTPLACDAGSTYVDPYGALAAFNTLLPDAGLALTLTLRPVNTNLLPVPPALIPGAFDGGAAEASLMACRFEHLLDFVFAQIPNVPLVSLQIGNEIDLYPGAQSVGFWGGYWTFLSQVEPYARSLRRGLRVGVTSTLAGLTGHSDNVLAQDGLSQLNKLGDVVGVTYYPVDENDQVEAPSVVPTDFAAAASNVPAGLPLFIEEAGYPSDPACGSSPDLQRQFIDALFVAWDAQASQIPLVNIVRLNDLSAADALSQAQGYESQPPAPFVADLESLGLRQYDGGAKPALGELAQEAALRGFSQ